MRTLSANSAKRAHSILSPSLKLLSVQLPPSLPETSCMRDKLSNSVNLLRFRKLRPLPLRQQNLQHQWLQQLLRPWPQHQQLWKPQRPNLIAQSRSSQLSSLMILPLHLQFLNFKNLCRKLAQLLSYRFQVSTANSGEKTFIFVLHRILTQIFSLFRWRRCDILLPHWILLAENFAPIGWCHSSSQINWRSRPNRWSIPSLRWWLLRKAARCSSLENWFRKGN